MDVSRYGIMYKKCCHSRQFDNHDVGKIPVGCPPFSAGWDGCRCVRDGGFPSSYLLLESKFVRLGVAAVLGREKECRRVRSVDNKGNGKLKEGKGLGRAGPRTECSWIRTRPW